jgi:hypothetical protein
MRDFDSASILKKREKKTRQNLWFLLSSGGVMGISNTLV